MSGTTRREFIRTVSAGAVSLSMMGAQRIRLDDDDDLSAARTGARPNILLIVTDDMGYSDLGCYGGEIRTPHLDRLAKNGVRFSQFYNAARCCPTRASLLTGVYPHQAGVGHMVSDQSAKRGPAYLGRLNDRCVTIAEVLRAAGYGTYLSGKWHVGEMRPHWPVDRGFDHHYGPVSGAMNYFDIRKAKTPGLVRHFAIDDQPHIPPHEGFYITDAITDHAVGYVRDHIAGPNPFFMYVAYTAPHWPLHALPEDIERYRGKYSMGWDKLRLQRHERQKTIGLLDDAWPLSPRDPQAAIWEDMDQPTRELMDLKMAIYAAQVDRLDQGVGRIIDVLRETGEFDNTLILFLSDNGACAETGPLGYDWRRNGLPPGGVDSYMSYGRSWSNASNTPFRLHKHWVHEGGISTPLIAHWPDGVVKSGRITHQPGHLIDIMATCCALAGAEYPREFNGKSIIPREGKSLMPIIAGGVREPHRALFWEHEGNRAVRMGKWKLVSRAREGWELYDLESDRTELNDLAGDHPEIAGELQNRHREWAERCGV